MKKGLLLILALVLLGMLTMLPMVALAEGLDLNGQTFFTWEALGTFSGAVALTVFMVQLLKLPLDKVWRIPTQYIVYVVSLGVMLLAQLFIPSRGGLTWDSGLLCVFNAMLVALSAMSVYTQLIEKVETDKLLRDIETGVLTISEGKTEDHPPDPQAEGGNG